TVSPSAKGRSGRTITVAWSSESTRLAAWLPLAEPSMTIAPAPTVAASSGPPIRMAMLFHGETRCEPGTGERYRYWAVPIEGSTAAAGGPAAALRHIHDAANATTTASRLTMDPSIRESEVSRASAPRKDGRNLHRRRGAFPDEMGTARGQ